MIEILFDKSIFIRRILMILDLVYLVINRINLAIIKYYNQDVFNKIQLGYCESILINRYTLN